jgi:hypothetical protein
MIFTVAGKELRALFSSPLAPYSSPLLLAPPPPLAPRGAGETRPPPPPCVSTGVDPPPPPPRPLAPRDRGDGSDL